MVDDDRDLRDITDRRRAEDALKRLAAIVEYSEEAIISKDAAGTILTWNEGAEACYGYTAAEAVGQSTSLIYPSDRMGEHVELMQKLDRECPSGIGKPSGERKDGQLFPCPSDRPLERWLRQGSGYASISQRERSRPRTPSNAWRPSWRIPGTPSSTRTRRAPS